MNQENFDDLSYDDKIKSLLLRHGVYETLVIDHEEDKPMVLMALQQPDIESIKIDEEGGLVIMYSGDTWSNNE
jgi:hypothetical protein